jgi:uncharacterized membrane protein
MALTVAVFLHVIAVVVWVGGMFLAYMAVRPAAVEALDARQRLRLWNGIFQRFFPWVWLAVLVIIGSGFMMWGMMRTMAPYIVVMAVIGVVMTIIFLHIFFAPYRRLKHAVAAEDWTAGGAALGQIRKLVGLNLVLGLVTVAVAILGRLF